MRRRRGRLTVDGRPLEEYLLDLSIQASQENMKRCQRQANGEPDDVVFVASEW